MSDNTEETKYYCYLDSGGPYTNLQLFSLKKAYDEWLSLSSDYEKYGEKTERLKEKLVFILSCLGISLSQLLGQNAVIIKKKIDCPRELLAAFLDESRYDYNKKKLLKGKFNKLIEYYDTCRHFGRVKGNTKWKKVDSLSFKRIEDFMQTTLEIWNAVISHHRADHIGFEDIRDILNGYI